MTIRGFLERKAAKLAERTENYVGFLRKSRSINFDERAAECFIGIPTSKKILGYVRNSIASVKKAHAQNVVERIGSQGELKGMDYASLEGALELLHDAHYRPSDVREKQKETLAKTTAATLWLRFGTNQHAAETYLQKNSWMSREVYGLESRANRKFCETGKEGNIFDMYLELAAAQNVLKQIHQGKDDSEIIRMMKSYAQKGNVIEMFRNTNQEAFIDIVDYYHNTDDKNSRRALEKIVGVARLSIEVPVDKNNSVNEMISARRKLADAVSNEKVTQEEYGKVLHANFSERFNLSEGEQVIYVSPESANAARDSLYQFVLGEVKRWGVEQKARDFIKKTLGLQNLGERNTQLEKKLVQFVAKQQQSEQSTLKEGAIDCMKASMMSQGIIKEKGEEGGSVYGMLIKNMAKDSKKWVTGVLSHGDAEDIAAAVKDTRLAGYNNNATSYGGMLAYARQIGIRDKSLDIVMEDCMVGLYNDLLIDAISANEFETAAGRMFREAGKNKGEYRFSDTFIKTIRGKSEKYSEMAKQKVTARNYEDHFARNDALNSGLRDADNKRRTAEKAYGIGLAAPLKGVYDEIFGKYNTAQIRDMIGMEYARARSFEEQGKMDLANKSRIRAKELETMEQKYATQNFRTAA